MKPIYAWGLLLLACTIQVASGVDSYDEKCSVTEGAGVRVDSCDASKYLTCQSGSRCRCHDEVNQLWDYRYAPQTPSRSKRSPKGGKGGKGGGFKGSKATPILAGAAAGAGGAYIGYQAGKAVGNAQSGNGGGTYYSVNNNNKKQNVRKEFACYGRVGSSCVLDYNNVNVVTIPTSTTTTATTPSTANDTTTPTPTTAGTDSTTLNSTTTATNATETTTSASVVAAVDLTKIPKCVRNAICVRQLPSNFSSGSSGVFKTEGDPRLGKCQCTDGYKATPTDQCVRMANSGNHNARSSLFSLVPLFFLYVSLSL